MSLEHHQIEQQGCLCIAHVDATKLSGADIDGLIEELANRMRCDGATRFILDLAKVEYVDSSCIGSLVTFLQDLQAVHGSLMFACCQPNVAFLFKVTRLDTIFAMFDDVEQARGAAA
ncbi:MAG: STAS domain-containing protein [Phycisphaeraceae bacterium]|nr:STAS domain-containing protein [Phycisphaeraceae bacterium]